MMEFDKIRRLNIKSRNSLFAGYSRSGKFFIKKYTIRPGREKEDLQKVQCELLCYSNNNLDVLNLPRAVETDYKNRQLILEYVHFIGSRGSKKTIDEVLDFQSSVMKKIDASFLPTVTFDYYDVTLRRLAADLENDEIMEEPGRIFDQFRKNKSAIIGSAKYFSHGDLRLGNIKYSNKKLAIIDLEHARRDNLMADLACVYVDMFDRTPLIDHLTERMASMKDFDKGLFNLMLYRRCIEVLHALKGNPDSRHYRNAKEIIKKRLE